MIIKDRFVERTGRYYQRGLERVAKVVEGVEGYDALLGQQRLAHAEYETIVIAHQGGRIADAASRMASLVRKKRLALPTVPDSACVISFAKTHNNRVQLEFFKRRTQRWWDAEICEISECAVEIGPPIGPLFGPRLEARLRRFLRAREVLSKSLVRQLVSYSVSHCAMWHSLRNRPFLKGVIVANDHSPAPVALSMVCAELGIKRVYLQHAQVTPIFPPLDFDYSILMNRASEQIYRDMGVPSGEIAVINRHPFGNSEEMVLRRIDALQLSAEVTVVLYPSAVFSAERLSELVLLLKSNRNITRILLKPHPSIDSHQIAESLELDLLKEVPAFAHVAIVGNSSVALQIASSGNLVFQDFGLDPVGRDYYGFCQEGLACELSMERATGQFWRQLDFKERLTAALKSRLSEDRCSLAPLDEESFLKKVIVEIGGALNGPVSSKVELHTCLRLFPRSFLALVRSRAGVGAGNDLQYILDLDALFNDRVLDLHSIYQLVKINCEASIIDFWFVIKRVEWSGFLLSQGDIENCSRFVESYEGDRKVKRWLETKLFDVLLRLRKFSTLAGFMRRAAHFDLARSHLNKKIAFLNSLNDPSAVAAGLDRFYCYQDDHGLSNLERLKVAVQCTLRRDGRLLYDDFSKVQADFVSFGPESVIAEYRQLVLPVFKRISGRDKYIDVKRKSSQARALIDLVCNQLDNGEGFSLVRLSDGEGYLFHGTNDYFTESDARNRERHWWGCELEKDLRDRVVTDGLEAVRHADVIGIPSIYRFLRDHSAKSKSLLTSVQGRGLIAVLQGVLDVASEDAHFGDDKLNIAVFNTNNNLQKMASSARQLVVVSGATESVVREVFGHLGNLTVIPIPTHHKTSSNGRFHAADRPLPYVMADVREQVRLASSPGTLVLVGAGVAGKSFVNAAKLAGGVGLDLGSALDQLVGAGIHSLH